METRWQIVDQDDNVIRTLSPVGVPKFTDERDLSYGLIDFRRKLANDLRFQGSDFEYFYSIERRAARRCIEMTVRYEIYCAGRYREFWRGTFSTGSGKWVINKSACSFSVRPVVVDDYTCLLKNLNKKVNVLKAETVDAQVALVIPLEFFVCSFDDFAGEAACATEAGDPDVTGWRELGDALDGPTVYRLYGRRREQTECVGGNPVPPPGGGWILLEDNCAEDGTAIYVKQLTDDEMFEANVTPVLGTCVDGVAVPPVDCPAVVLVEDCDENDPPIYACIGQSTQPLTGARLLRTVLETLIEGCDVDSVVSDFFEWDPPGDAVGYVAGENYVTGQTNQVDGLIMVQKSDAIDPFATQAATIGELSLKEVLALLANALRVFWRIDEDGRMRFEHWQYWSFPVGLDLADYTEKEKIEPLAYDHLTSEVPRLERLTFAEAQSRDFVGVDIQYQGPCATDDETAKDWSAGPFTTDIAFIQTSSSDVSKTGFAFLATKLVDGVYNVIIGEGALTGNIISNAPLATANLQDAYWRSDRYLPNASMNKVDETFDAFLPTVEQKGVMVKLCCQLNDFNPAHMVTTELGDVLDADGSPIRVEYDMTTGAARFSLRYAY